MRTRLPLSRLPTSERTARRAEKVSAWVLHGGEVRQWIQACLDLGLDQKKLRIFPIKMDGSEQAVLIGGSNSAGFAASSLHARPLHRLFDRLWIPYDAEPALPLFAGDIEDLIVADFALLLPDSRIMHFSLNHGLKMVDLLLPLNQNECAWQSAREGKVLGFSLKSIHTLNPASVDDFLNESQGDIGTKEIENIESLDQSAGALKKLFHKGKKGIEILPGGKLVEGAGKGVVSLSLGALFIGLKGVGKALDSISSDAPMSNYKQNYKPGLIDKLTKWTGEKIANLKRSQQQEIEKLIEKLKKDPDLGLQYALPLNGGAGRGITDAAASLSRENLNFNLSNLGNGGAFTPWDLDYDHHQRLTVLYRENANREVSLGRYRRAAYIYAHLLDDLNSAADVLAQGGFYQEAAALYHKLNNKEKEAACWVKAGEIDKAVALYKQLNDYQAIADLYTQLGRDDDAEKVWRDYIAQLLRDQDPLNATSLMIKKFDETEEAIRCLKSYWHGSAHAEQCLKQEMIYRERYQNTEQYEERIEELMNPSDRAFVNDRLLKVFNSLRETTTVFHYRKTLANAEKILASSILLDPKKPSAFALKCLKKLEKQDDIIRKDVTRFARDERSIMQELSNGPSKESNQTDTLESKLIHSERAVLNLYDALQTRLGIVFYSVTQSHQRVMSIRFKEGGEVDRQILSWMYEERSFSGRLSIAHNAVQEQVMVSPIYTNKNLIIFKQKSNEHLTAYWGSGAPVLATCLAPNGTKYELFEQNGVECYLKLQLNNLTETFQLTAVPEAVLLSEENMQFFLQATDKAVFFVIGELFGKLNNGTVTWITEIVLSTRLRTSSFNPNFAMVISSRVIICHDEDNTWSIPSETEDGIKDAVLLDKNTIAVLSGKSNVTIYRINEDLPKIEKLAEHKIPSKPYDLIVNGSATRSVILISNDQRMLAVEEFILPAW